MKKALILAITMLVCISSSVLADTFGAGANQFEIEFVSISSATNPSSGYGIVNHDYRMGTYEITNDQWTKFTNSLGVPVTGSPSYAYMENPQFSSTDPTNNVSWYEAAQFVNWLNTSTNHAPAYKFAGTQGTSGYMLEVWQPGDMGYDVSDPFRNSNAYYFLPTEDEWVKAAYWNGSTLQAYATAGDTFPVAGVDANYGMAIGQPWQVGNGTEELNGTYDMMGNVFEWMESPYIDGSYLPDADRGVRGCSYKYDDTLSSSSRISFTADFEYTGVGFRVATVPEPATVVLLALGGLALRRRKY